MLNEACMCGIVKIHICMYIMLRDGLRSEDLFVAAMVSHQQKAGKLA
jgi:hypothetical protein